MGEGKEQVLLDVKQVARASLRAHDAHQIAAQRVMPALHCYVCPGAHCVPTSAAAKAGASFRTVTGHRDLVALRAQFVDQFFLSLAVHRRTSSIPNVPPRRPARCAFIVSGCHNNARNPCGVIPDCLRRAALIGSATAIPASVPSTDEHRRLALGAQGVGACVGFSSI
jgi:hypothetical protein